MMSKHMNLMHSDILKRPGRIILQVSKIRNKNSVRPPFHFSQLQRMGMFTRA